MKFEAQVSEVYQPVRGKGSHFYESIQRNLSMPLLGPSMMVHVHTTRSQEGGPLTDVEVSYLGPDF